MTDYCISLPPALIANTYLQKCFVQIIDDPLHNKKIADQ